MNKQIETAFDYFMESLCLECMAHKHQKHNEQIIEKLKGLADCASIGKCDAKHIEMMVGLIQTLRY